MEKVFWGWIYKITSPSGRVYIGQTNNIKRRHYEYETMRCSSQHRLMASFAKYGFENHRMEILWTGPTTRSLLSVLEMEYIDEYNSSDQRSGMNVISYTKANKSTYNSEYRDLDLPRKKWQRKPMTAYQYEILKTYNPLFNDELRAKMLERLRSDEVRAKLRAARAKQPQKYGKDHRNSIPVDQFTVDGIFLKRWDCAADISREIGVRDCKVAAVCKGKRKTTGGFVFKYASQ